VTRPSCPRAPRLFERFPEPVLLPPVFSSSLCGSPSWRIRDDFSFLGPVVFFLFWGQSSLLLGPYYSISVLLRGSPIPCFFAWSSSGKMWGYQSSAMAGFLNSRFQPVSPPNPIWFSSVLVRVVRLALSPWRGMLS